jgi:hypothetical protein
VTKSVVTVQFNSAGAAIQPIFVIDHRVGAGESERFCRFEIDHEMESRRLFDGEGSRLVPFEDLVDVACRASPVVTLVGGIRHETSGICLPHNAVHRRQPIPGDQLVEPRLVRDQDRAG